jgi:hypothetical protein
VNRYSARIVLHAAKWPEDYELLHLYMALAKFRRTVPDDDGREFELPPGEYYFVGDVSIETVRTLAMSAAQRTGRKFGVLVTRWDQAAWYLPPAAPAPLPAPVTRALVPPPPPPAPTNALIGLQLGIVPSLVTEALFPSLGSPCGGIMSAFIR